MSESRQPDRLAPIEVRDRADALRAAAMFRTLAASVTIRGIPLDLASTAVIEIAQNMVTHAGGGTIELSVVTDDAGRTGVRVHAEDHGPGIEDLDSALQEGFSSSGGLGLGLPGVYRLMDEVEIVSKATTGTVVTMVKWAPA